jgi:hypothetical protein
MHLFRALYGRTAWLALSTALAACSVYDSGLLVHQRPDAVTTRDSGDGDIAMPGRPSDRVDSGAVLGPDESPPGAAGSETRCGDGQLTGIEKCDMGIAAGKPGACPTSCPPLAKCTPRVLNGTACQATCELRELICESGDNCCPGKCTTDNDSDCSPSCGDGIVQETAGETCEAKSDTPCKKSDAECDDGNACTSDKLTGSASNCNAVCTNTLLPAATEADGCCPEGANATTDGDCEPKCGNGVLERSEDCDGGSSCTADCKRTGSMDQARCLAAAKTDCEKCSCTSCTATEMACRMGDNADANTKCSAVLTCSQMNNCVDEMCYCASPLCVVAGACQNQILTAAGTTDVTMLQTLKMDLNNPLGKARSADVCRTTMCASACRP